jgi:hypothetical protein
MLDFPYIWKGHSPQHDLIERGRRHTAAVPPYRRASLKRIAGYHEPVLGGEPVLHGLLIGGFEIILIC